MKLQLRPQALHVCNYCTFTKLQGKTKQIENIVKEATVYVSKFTLYRLEL